jgi:hypothetical protein
MEVLIVTVVTEKKKCRNVECKCVFAREREREREREHESEKWIK